MDFIEFMGTLGGWINQIYQTINQFGLHFGSTVIGIGNILITLVLLSMIVSVFWKGARG